MLLPASTGSGESLLVAERSALAWTVVVAVALSLLVSGSVLLSEPTLAVFVIVLPFSSLESTATLSVYVMWPPAARDGMVHSIVPPLPGSGVLHSSGPPVMSENEVPFGTS